MYLRKVPGPRSVTLADGTVMTRSDLPPADTRRWVASRKARVVQAVEAGLVTVEEMCSRYALSDEELASWRRAVSRHGPTALKTTRLQQFRDPDAAEGGA